MSLLLDHPWLVKYTPDDGNLVKLLYVPALRCAVRYDRLTGYFSASALALAARGVEGLLMNQGRMRMVVGCTLGQAEIDAISKGEALKAAVERSIIAVPLDPVRPDVVNALELLAWMIAQGHLEVKIAIPCDASRKPIVGTAIFHEKAGIIEDRTGERIAFNGSLNETAAGWTQNWESLNVFTSWDDAKRVAKEEDNFARIWADRAGHVLTIDVPTAVRDDLFRFLPEDNQLPARLVTATPEGRNLPSPQEEPSAEAIVELAPAVDLRKLVWGFIRQAPKLANGGERVGEVTCAVTPWPHQVRAFDRMYGKWPTKLLIADEVGLGKTVQAGLLIRQALLAGRARRILIMVPRNVRPQWQVEMREKFNLNIPIYDGQKLVWYDSPAMRGALERPVGRDVWHQEPILIVSSHLMRRRDRQAELLEAAEPWDLVVLDEAHHARRKGAGSATEGGPNALLKLMRGLRQRTQALVMLTATPMQVAPVEVWDLLDLLGMPPEWHSNAFVRFFQDIETPNPSNAALDNLAAMFRACEAAWGALTLEDLKRPMGDSWSKLKAKKILAALRDESSIPRRQLETKDRVLAINTMRANTPVARLISRHTRELLRAYYKAGKITTPIADRVVVDQFVELTLPEREVYDEVERYISETYNQAADKEKSAVGFVLTIYRKRLASSFFALRKTLENHLAAIEASGKSGGQLRLIGDDDLPDEDETLDETPDIDEAEELERQALNIEEKGDIERLLEAIRALPPDTKLGRLLEELAALRGDGYRQAMVFTGFTDTMDFLRDRVADDDPTVKVMCFSGRGGEVRDADGSWRKVSRDEVKRRFREGQADVLLCTDAAAEGLNFQFCGSLVNYDLPWNPMRVEQRIGRIDRLGQKFGKVRIVNLHYADTVEADVYCSLRDRIGLFQSVVGKLQPILAKLPTLIAGSILKRKDKDGDSPELALVHDIGAEAEAASNAPGFDLDAVTAADLEEPHRPSAPLDMDALELLLRHPDVLPPGLAVRPMGNRQWAFSAPGIAGELRISTDPKFVEEHPDDVELWSPGNPLFPVPEVVAEAGELPPGARLDGILRSATPIHGGAA